MFPSLSPEIILHIIRLSLPLDEEIRHRERCDDLCTYALVSKVWRSLAQEELFKRPTLEDAVTTDRFFSALPAHLASRFQSLVLGHPGRLEEAPVAGPWTTCSSVTEVQVIRSYVRFDRLAAMKTLRVLHLYIPIFRPDYMGVLGAGVPLFNHVEHLSLSDIRTYSDEQWVPLLCPAVFPALRSIALGEKAGHAMFDAERGFLSALRSIGPQILTLAIIDDTEDQVLERLLLPCWDSFSALEHLVLRGQEHESYQNGFPDIYAALPSTLQTVSIVTARPRLPVHPHVTLLHLQASLRSNTRSLRGLKRISVPPSTIDACLRPYSNTKAQWESEAKSTRANLKSLAASRGIELDETYIIPQAAAWYQFWVDISWYW